MGAASRKSQILQYIGQQGWEKISEAEFTALKERFAAISEDYLRRVLRRIGVPLAPLVEGVRQDSFESLERTLLAILQEYEAAVVAGDRNRMQECRRVVIQAKRHAKLAVARMAGQKQKEKNEMLLWLLEWLENPGVFPQWLKLRKRALLRHNDQTA